MQAYNCKVRLHGSLYNEVPKDGISAAEVTVLRVIHGHDAIADLVAAGDNGRDEDEEREFLHHEYGRGLAVIDEVKSLNGIFGVAGSLPRALKEVEHAKSVAPAAAKRGRPAKAEPDKKAQDSDKVDDADLDIPVIDTDEDLD